MPHKTKLVLVVALLALGATGALAKGQKPVRPQQEMAFGVKMAQRGLWAEALFRFREAEKLGDTRSALYNNIAVAYEALGIFDKAQEYYRKALDSDPRNAPMRRNYSRFVEFYQSFQTEEEAVDEDDEDAAEVTGSS